MHIIRRAKVDDTAMLLKLAKMVHFINLPPDKDIITQKIVHSRNCFLSIADAQAKPEPEPVPAVPAGIRPTDSTLEGLGESSAHTDLFVFVLEDSANGNVLGTSQTLASMGGPGNPNFSYRLEKRHYFSESLQTGTTQTVAVLQEDVSGPTEIGGLILQPSYRGHPEKLGYFLSVVRFHFMGLYRERFADRVIAEMMAPITADSHNLLWDFMGRRFVPLSYDEADRFCQYSREFIATLLPREPLFLSLLPPAARAVVGQVGPETRSARRMLEKLGFVYDGVVDPFDGGPHLSAVTSDIPLVRDTRWTRLGKPARASALKRRGIVSVLRDNGEFFAVHKPIAIAGDGTVSLGQEESAALGVEPGDRVGFTPTDGKPASDAAPADAKRSASNKPAKKPKKPAAQKTANKKTANKKSAKNKSAKKPAKK